MAIVKCKGTTLKQDISGVFTAIAQLISIDLPDMETETYEADTLDNTSAGIPYGSSGRTEGGSMGGELFFDPALTGHKALLALLTTPADETWQIVFADTGATTWNIGGAGISFGGTVALGDGLKGTLKIKLDGSPNFPA
jgi:hypothetical protein